jgi:hypothetical protein
VKVAAGGIEGLALKDDGTVWIWGLGTIKSPVHVSGLLDIVDISVFGRHNLALSRDGTVWSWYDDQAATQVPGLSHVVRVATGYDHALTVKSDGTVWGWGENQYGQLGDGTTTGPRTTPVQMVGISNAVDVAAGERCSFVIKEDGTVWASGTNGNNRLGLGNTTPTIESTPVQVPRLNKIVQVATSFLHGMALKADGTVWLWGTALLGDGTQNYDHPFPELVPGMNLGSDADGNGIFDIWELFYFGQSGVDPHADPDGDGLTNVEEFQQGTNPVDPTEVSDTTPPAITITATPATLWPPNGKLVPVTVSGTIMDEDSASDEITAAYEVMDEYGSVQPHGEVTVAADGTYAFTIDLQASRNGNDKNGRQYSITVRAHDNAGNEGIATTRVLVPHDQGH